MVRPLHDLSDLDDARRVFDAVWPAADGSTQVPGNLLRAIVHSGGYAAAAYRGGEPIGAALLAWFMLGESLALTQLAGFTLVVVAVLLAR